MMIFAVGISVVCQMIPSVLQSYSVFYKPSWAISAENFGTGLAYFGAVMGATLGGWGGTLGGIGNLVGLTHRVGRLLENARKYAAAEEAHCEKAQSCVNNQEATGGENESDESCDGDQRPGLRRAITSQVCSEANGGAGGGSGSGSGSGGSMSYGYQHSADSIELQHVLIETPIHSCSDGDVSSGQGVEGKALVRDLCFKVVAGASTDRSAIGAVSKQAAHLIAVVTVCNPLCSLLCSPLCSLLLLLAAQ
jgi:hypothetical protein